MAVNLLAFILEFAGLIINNNSNNVDWDNHPKRESLCTNMLKQPQSYLWEDWTIKIIAEGFLWNVTAKVEKLISKVSYNHLKDSERTFPRKRNYLVVWTEKGLAGVRGERRWWIGNGHSKQPRNSVSDHTTGGKLEEDGPQRQKAMLGTAPDRLDEIGQWKTGEKHRPVWLSALNFQPRHSDS